MKKNLLLKIEYDGTNYYGFQIQNKPSKKEVTVQQLIEQSLQKLFNEKIPVYYVSRTDRGVHAFAQYCNFQVETCIPLANIKIALNTFLPEDIRVVSVKKVQDDFHARYSVKSKIYRYKILNKKEKDVFLRNKTWHVSSTLDVTLMRTIAPLLVGKKDFSRFANHAKKYENCVRTVKSITLFKSTSYLFIDIEADGFLYNMVRNIVTFLVLVGKGTLSTQDAKRIIKGSITYVNKPAPAQGLYLYKVKY